MTTKTIAVPTINGSMDAEHRHTLPSGKLAVTRFGERWSITHLPSGLELYGSSFITLKAIREMAKMLDGWDWNFTYPWDINASTYKKYKQFNIDHGLPVGKRPKRENYPAEWHTAFEKRLKQVSAT